MVKKFGFLSCLWGDIELLLNFLYSMTTLIAKLWKNAYCILYLWKSDYALSSLHITVSTKPFFSFRTTTFFPRIGKKHEFQYTIFYTLKKNVRYISKRFQISPKFQKRAKNLQNLKGFSRVPRGRFSFSFLFMSFNKIPFFDSVRNLIRQT